MEIETNIDDQMNGISDLLDVALDHELELETIYYALVYMKNNPTATPLEAFQLGISEWIK
jgi:hypothetical protein